MKRIFILVLFFMILNFLPAGLKGYADDEQKIVFDGKSLLMSGKMEDVIRRKNKLAFSIRMKPVSPQVMWPQQTEIFVMNSDGSDLRRLTFSDEFTDNIDKKWIDDKTIAYRRLYRKRGDTYLKININDLNEEEISWEYYESIRE